MPVLKTIPLFANLSEDALALLAQHLVVKSYPKNAILVNEGDATDSMFIIQSGRVKVYLSDEEGKEVMLNIHSEGEYFGEIALLDERPRSASVMTLTDCRLWMISKQDFEAWLKQHPSVSLILLRDLASRLRLLTDNVKSLALMDVYGRVARVLLNLAAEKEGKLCIEERLTQQDIANMVGASREMVSRIMKDLTMGGYVTIGKTGIVINERLPSHW
ncbi:MAG: CRP/FNR family transcriptional regulator cyclic AMP receptor protein [Halothiobacillaceae bacterium]|nr:MAG: CRP/FNR family transcriptional regulator cyclic AMP receptor protein [Halothiobacillaceae bacterium]